MIYFCLHLEAGMEVRKYTDRPAQDRKYTDTQGSTRALTTHDAARTTTATSRIFLLL